MNTYLSQEWLNDLSAKNTPIWKTNQVQEENYLRKARCRLCNWEGLLKDCIKVIRLKEENEPVCPKCGSTRIDW